MKERIWSLPPALGPIRRWANTVNIDIYIVGGWVRDSLLGLPAWDADLSGPTLPEDVSRLLPEDGTVTMTLRDAGLGTVELHADGVAFEYTAFRRESYRPGGAHRPSHVELGATLPEDALRRDFTVNAMYLRLNDLTFLDPTGGLEDLKKEQLATTRTPEEVLDEDGLRLLRLVRQAAELQFRPARPTWEAAKAHVGLLAGIAPERLREELTRILTADLRHPEKAYRVPPVVTALTDLADLGVWFVLCPEAEKSASDPARILAAATLPADPTLRLAALWADLSEEALDAACARLRLTREETRRIRLLAPLSGKALTEAEFRLCCASLGRQDAGDLTALRRALARQNLSAASDAETDWLDAMVSSGVPFALPELALRGRDLIPLLGGASPKIGVLLNELWRHVILHPEDNEQETLIRLAREKETTCKNNCASSR